ncbi:MAG: DUF3822 family protein [Bacteroidota bacterium]
MGQLKRNIVEDSFSLNSTASYDLSILVGVDRFFYLVNDDQNRVLALRQYNFANKGSFVLLKSPLKLTLVNDKLLGQGYRKTRVGLFSKRSALIPESLFETGKEQIYLTNTSPAEDVEKVFNDKVEGQGVRNVYAFNREIWQLLNTYFPKAVFYHASTPLIGTTGKLPLFQEGSHLLVNVIGQDMQIIHFDKGKIIFHNTFTYQTTNDFVYYVMLVIDQLGLRAEKISTSLSGELMEASEIFEQITRYIRHVNFVNRPSFLRYSSNFDNLPEHLFFDLYSLKLCG